MAHDPVKVADALAWMKKADSDMRCAILDSRATPPLLEDALFHCQQVVEKSLKAWLAWNDIPFRKIYSIEELCEACIETAPELSEILDRAPCPLPSMPGHIAILEFRRSRPLMT